MTAVTKRDLRSNPPPAIGCATHATPQAEMPCGVCRRQGELFTRATAAEKSRAREVSVMAGWRDQALCREVDPDLFFPIGDGPFGQWQIAQAKAVCAECPVAVECLAFAMRFLPDGIAGGTTAAERSEMRRRSRPVRSRPAERREAASRLRSRGWPAAAIAKQLGINERSVYRLLKRAVA